MTPNISPPTDNLYKFIALFGLAIFLFSLFKSSDVFEAVTKSKLEIEDLKLEVNGSLGNFIDNNNNIYSDTASVNVVPVMVKRISNDLNGMANAVEESNLEGFEREVLLTKIRKIQVQNDNLQIRTNEFLISLLLGFILIIIGFIFWYKKEQSIKDKILLFELEKATLQGKEYNNYKNNS